MKETEAFFEQPEQAEAALPPEKDGHDSVLELAHKILGTVMRFRRLPHEYRSCANENCSACASAHLPRILASVRSGEKITFVLPAFPGKSPNPSKVLGALPDLAEELSLQFLTGLAREIRRIYSPGAEIIICSDGRVFSDVVGMKENDVSAYQNRLSLMIEEMSAHDISTFNLDDVFGELSFAQMRDELMKGYGKSLELLKHRIRNGTTIFGSAEEQEANRMYRGMTRFLFEDAQRPGQTKSRTAIQNEARTKAYEVIRRSNAWSDLIEERFPHAVRLSIHPQTCGAKKLGIRLVANESWMTPWHGVAVKIGEGFVLMKRAEAEALNAKLVLNGDGSASHFEAVSATTGVFHEL